MSTISILGSILPARLMIDGFIGAWNGSNMEPSSKVDPTIFAEIRPQRMKTAVREWSNRRHVDVENGPKSSGRPSYGRVLTMDQGNHFEVD